MFALLYLFDSGSSSRKLLSKTDSEIGNECQAKKLGIPNSIRNQFMSDIFREVSSDDDAADACDHCLTDSVDEKDCQET